MSLDPKWMRAFNRDGINAWVTALLFCIASLSFLHYDPAMVSSLPVWVIKTLWLALLLSVCVVAIHIFDTGLKSRG